MDGAARGADGERLADTAGGWHAATRGTSLDRLRPDGHRERDALRAARRRRARACLRARRARVRRRAKICSVAVKKHVLILGAGFAGLELATRLSTTLPDAVQVTLLDRNDSFHFGFSKLDVLLGRRTADDVRMRYRDISK